MARSLKAIVAFNSLPMAAEIKQAIVASGNYLGLADDYVIERAGRILARLRLLDAYIDRLGASPIDSCGRMRGVCAWP